MNHYHNRIVVKVGTSTLTNEMGKTDLQAFDKLACVLSDVQNKGYEVILVSSGVILCYNKYGNNGESLCYSYRRAYIYENCYY